MKKTVWILLLLLAALMIFSSCADREACAHDVVKGRCRSCGVKPSQGLELVYHDDRGGYALVGLGNCTDEAVIVPARYKGKPVVYAAGFENDGFVKKIYLPSSITSFSPTFLNGATALEEVYLQGGSVEGFKNCAALRKVYLASGVKGLGAAFVGASSLTEVTLEEGREKPLFSWGAFTDSGLVKNKTLYVDGGLYIGDFLLAVDPDATELVIRDGTQNMSAYALRGMTKLESLVIGKSVVFDLSHSTTATFEDCVSLKKLVTASNLTALTGLPANLEELEYRVGVTAVGKAKECRMLKKVILPEGLRSLPPDAFTGCKALSEVKLPSTLQSIGARAFAGCLSLGEVMLPDGLQSIEANAFVSCVSLKSVRLPSSLKYLGASAFQQTAIEWLVIPSGVEAVGATVSSAKAYFCGAEAPGKGWTQNWHFQTADKKAEVYYKGQWTYENSIPVPKA